MNIDRSGHLKGAIFDGCGGILIGAAYDGRNAFINRAVYDGRGVYNNRGCYNHNQIKERMDEDGGDVERGGYAGSVATIK